MKLRFMSILLILAFTLFFGGCQKNKLAEKYVFFHQEKQLNEFDQNISSLINGTNMCDSVKVQSVNIHQFVQRYTGVARPYVHYMSELVNDIGIGLLRETEEGTLYSIYSVDQGGKLVVFYNNEEWRKETEDRPILRWFYIREELCFNDFKELIENKCSMEEVIRVDETEQIFENIWFGDWPFDEQKPEEFITWHYLSDGILQLWYRQEQGKTVVFDYVWNPDFDLEDWQAAVHRPYNARVLDIDWFPY